MFLRDILRRRPEPTTQGALEEVSDRHVAGWLLDAADPAQPVPYEVVCGASGAVLATGVADQYRHHLHWHEFGGASHSFHTRLAAPSGAPLGVRAAGNRSGLARADGCRTRFEPFVHVALDLVDNCNLRCPFCIYDYSNTRATHLMTEAHFLSALRLLPHTRDGQFWLSCLHEPTLHPDMMALVDRVPAEYRRKLMFTTNLAKRMPDAYFSWLAHSGVYSINISVESRDPALYERMRKGARHRIFAENWDLLLAAFAAAPAPPRLRYIAMAYRSNLAELPGLATHLLERCRAWQVELRYTFDLPYIPAAFRAAEFLEDPEWDALRASLPPYPGDRLLLIAPPRTASPGQAAAPGPGEAPVATPASPSAPPRFLPDHYMLQVSWDGTVRASGMHSRAGERPSERDMLVTSLDEIESPAGLLDRLTGVPG